MSATADTAAEASRPRSDGGPNPPPPLLARVLDPLSTRPLLGDAVLAVMTVVVGAALRFTQDDAFITLRYSRNLADGNGLVFNLGERVEGYTNFLWTAWLAVPHALGVDPILWSDVSSILAGVATVLVTRRVARRVVGDDRWALVAAGLLVAFHSFAIYLTGGLETQWQTCWVLGIVALLAGALDGPVRPAHIAGASLLAGLALLTRLDSAVLLVATGVPVVVALRRRGELDATVAATALGPAAVVVGPWLVWKWTYYDHLLPNTFVAKQTPLGWALVRGSIFLALFALLSFGFVALPLVRRGWAATRATPTGRLLRWIIAAWLVYLMWVGADFMEFRFLVPVMPAGMILLVAATSRLDARRALAVIAVVAVGSLVKWAAFYPALIGIESARALSEHVTQPAGWREAGRVLADDFPDGEAGGPTIAITAAGALPYDARLRTVDMLGLTDEGADEAANRWELTRLKAGHEHIATVDYLVRSRVDLVLGGLVTEDCGSVAPSEALGVVRDMFLTHPVRRADVPADARLLEIPLRSNGKCLYALDLSRGERRHLVDAAGYSPIAIPR